MATADSDYARAIPNWSHNCWDGTDPKNGRLPLTHVVLHGTGGPMPGCLQWLCRPNGDSSAHYLVARDGTVYQLVHENDVAWANGEVSPGGIFPASPNPNRFTLSIETENDTNNSLPHTSAQHTAVVDLIRDMRRRHGALALIPHSAVDPVNRAFCPGPKIDVVAIDKESMPAMKQLPGIPVWNQLNDPLPDGNQDPQAANDCGDECVAMLLKAYGCPALPAGQIRMLLHGITGSGITTADDLVRALGMFHDTQGRVIAAHSRQCDAATFRIEATRAINAGLPIVALGDWVARGAAHWMIGRGADDTGLMVNDPWQGRNRFVSWADVTALYDGAYVHVDVSIGSLPVQRTLLLEAGNRYRVDAGKAQAGGSPARPLRTGPFGPSRCLTARCPHPRRTRDTH